MSIDDKGSPAPYVDDPVGRNGDVDEKRGNAADRADMYRMGKAQEMRVCTHCFWLLCSGSWPC